ncbi:cupin domain-containing protein [Pseudomonas sp. GCEP-101]|uniref:cupin domain-containing protein n=1 Tax=Pseudomonas sp. GCEP-101 TaxID=2974552 RepID=UPI00223ADDD5|nr:cupin domain-containing protein [Pseudomonas sp. GCEP-101]
MHPTPFILTPSERSPALNVVGIRINVLVADTDSAAQRITFQTGEEGAGPPPHTHDWDESFYVLHGEVVFTVAERTAACHPGTLIHIPAGTLHGFHFGPGGGEMLEITGSQSQAIEMFRALDRELPPGPLDVPKTVAVAGEYGVIFRL